MEFVNLYFGVVKYIVKWDNFLCRDLDNKYIEIGIKGELIEIIEMLIFVGYFLWLIYKYLSFSLKRVVVLD